MRAALVLAAATLSACDRFVRSGADAGAGVERGADPLHEPPRNARRLSPRGRVNAIQIARWDGLSNMIGRRDTSGVHERHEAFTDIFVVQRGRARLLYGGTVEGERASSPGEWRGGTIRGGTEAEIKPATSS